MNLVTERWKSLVAWSALALVAGCSTVRYVPPSDPASQQNSVVLARPREAVWDAAVARLTRRFFVINNMDRASGYMNLSYSGPADDYVDCGEHLLPAAGASPYSSSLRQPKPSGAPGELVRRPAQERVSLDGRISLVLEALSDQDTRVTVTVHYTLTDAVELSSIESGGPTSVTATFTTGERGRFPADYAGDRVQCVSTGRLERTILDLIQE